MPHHALVEVRSRSRNQRSQRSGRSCISEAPTVEPHARRRHQELARIQVLADCALDSSDMDESKRAEKPFNGFVARCLRYITCSPCRSNDDTFGPAIPEKLRSSSRFLAEELFQFLRIGDVGTECDFDHPDQAIDDQKVLALT